jgi:hypothetical protein
VHHPDDMTTEEQFRIFIEERPEDAARALSQGSEAMHCLEAIYHRCTDVMDRQSQREMMMPVLHPQSGSVAEIATKYGMLIDRYAEVTGLVAGVMGIIGETVHQYQCPTCSTEDPDVSDN